MFMPAVDHRINASPYRNCKSKADLVKSSNSEKLYSCFQFLLFSLKTWKETRARSWVFLITQQRLRSANTLRKNRHYC